jgi:signal transduction histidine kinase
MSTATIPGAPPQDAAVADTRPAATSADSLTSWQERADRIGRFALLPVLGVATLLTWLTVAENGAERSRFASGLIVVGVAALWSVAMTRYPVSGVPVRVRFAVFAVHALLAGVLVWVHPWYGVFAFTCYFFADELTPRLRTTGFVTTALLLAASQTGGYPDGRLAHLIAFGVMAAFNVAAVLSMVGLTNRIMRQNAERGRIITDLASANRRLEASMAENAGLHAQLLVQAREAGVIEERQRLACEIHDTLAQGLIGIIAQLEAARQARGEPREWSRHLDLADSLARANLTEARRSVRALRPEQLDTTALPEALASLAQEWSRRCQIPATVETNGDPARAAAEIESAAFRIVQEALSNVAKHARATSVRVTVSYLDDVLLLDVVDDGVGFRTGQAPPPGSFGLAGMRRRLEPLAGTLTVESRPNDGTTLNAAIPLPPPPAKRDVG